jgi:triacylglycerol esterase/lipase EstA (alpha/beta hydrolase family)
MNENPNDEPKNSLHSFSQFLKNTAHSTGKGIKFLYEKGNEHKHYIGPVINGVMGNHLENNHSKRAIQMSFRVNGKDVSIENLDIRQNLENSNKKLIVFVHGLMADEVFFQEPFKGNLGLGAHLTNKGNTVLYIRYNTGKHISTNGQELSHLLEKLYTHNKDSINDITIIAHSMGGLVSRSSNYYAQKFNHSWLNVLKKIFLIGVPNEGSYLEKAGHLTTFVLKNIWNYHTKLIAKIADERSDGIKDLRYGYLIDEDWQQKNTDKLFDSSKTLIPPIPTIVYYILTATLSESEDSLVSQYFGDGLVGKISATGKDFEKEIDTNQNIKIKSFPKLNHLTLLTNDEVFDFVSKNII